MTSLFDIHSHLNLGSYDEDFEKVLDRARQRNINIIIPGIDLKTSKRAVEIAQGYGEGVYAAVGLHPNSILEESFDIAAYKTLAAHPKVVAFGEVGLDYFRIPESIRPESIQMKEELERGKSVVRTPEDIKNLQKKILREFLNLSKESRLPLILHCREAHEELIELLAEFNSESKGFDSRGVIHCFSGNWEDALRYFNLNFVISFTGVVTYAHFRGEVIVKAPLEKILVETDSPYLCPEPYRTCRNEPVNVELVAAEIARLKGIEYAQVEKVTTNTVLGIFSKIGKLSPELRLKIPWRAKGARSGRKVFLRARR